MDETTTVTGSEIVAEWNKILQPTPAEARKAQIDAMTQQERLDLLADLVSLVSGPLPLGGDKIVFLPVASSSIGVGKGMVPLSVPVYTPFKPKRLVILEPEVTVEKRDEVVNFFRRYRKAVDAEMKEATETFDKAFWKREPGATLALVRGKDQMLDQLFSFISDWRRVEYVTYTKPYRRNNWRIASLFCGQRAQFLSQSTLSGDAFGPDNVLDFDGEVCQPGHNITLSVQNVGLHAAPFIAVILGEGMEEVRDSSPNLTDTFDADSPAARPPRKPRAKKAPK